MNRKQIVVMWCGVAGLVACGLWVPWVKHPKPDKWRIWGSLWQSPFGGSAARIDFDVIGLEWLMIAIVTIALILTLRSKRHP